MLSATKGLSLRFTLGSNGRLQLVALWQRASGGNSGGAQHAALRGTCRAVWKPFNMTGPTLYDR
jgi:hypothetical protein